ncbi:MAG: DUF4399 domain-containing protein [Pseudomonadota bacterium]
MRMLSLILAAFMILLFNSSAVVSATMSPEKAMVYIISPADGATVPSTFTVNFGLKGMGVAPAGMDKKNTGHHHLLIDAKELPDLSQPLGKNVKHFGGGQTEAELTLSKGEHTLQLILGDKLHSPHKPPVVSKKITIEVK